MLVFVIVQILINVILVFWVAVLTSRITRMDEERTACGPTPEEFEEYRRGLEDVLDRAETATQKKLDELETALADASRVLEDLSHIPVNPEPSPVLASDAPDVPLPSDPVESRGFPGVRVPVGNANAEVLRLHQQGESADAIARKLRLSQREVRLMLSLRGPAAPAG